MQVLCLLSLWLSVGHPREIRTFAEITRACTHDWNWSVLCSKTLPHQMYTKVYFSSLKSIENSLYNLVFYSETGSHVESRLVSLYSSGSLWSSDLILLLVPPKSWVIGIHHPALYSHCDSEHNFTKAARGGRCFPPANTQDFADKCKPLSAVIILYMCLQK